MEVTPSVPEPQPDTPTPTAAPASQPPPHVPPKPIAAASTSHTTVKEKVGPTPTSGGVRVAKDSRHLEQALGSVDLEETLSPGQCLCDFLSGLCDVFWVCLCGTLCIISVVLVACT